MRPDRRALTLWRLPLLALCLTGALTGLAFANSARYNSLCLAIPWAEALPHGGRVAVAVAP